MSRYFRQPDRRLGLLLTPEELTLIDAEHGPIFTEPVVLARHPRSEKIADWGFAALMQPEATLVYPLQAPSWNLEEISAYLAWAIQRIVPLAKASILMPLQNLNEPIHHGFWHAVYRRLGVKAWELRSTTDFLPGGPHWQGCFYLADGLADLSFGAGSQAFYCGSVSYGRFLSRALSHYLFQTYQALIEESTARRVWQRISGLAHGREQVTVTGLLASGQEEYIMLVSEELLPIFRSAFSPIAEEGRYQLALLGARLKQTELEADVRRHGFRLAGSHAALPGLATHLQQKMQLPVTVVPQPDQALAQGLAAWLQSSRVAT